MTTSIIKTLSQPTKKSGEAKTGLWVTKGLDMVTDGTVTIDMTQNGAAINGTDVPNDVLVIKALKDVFDAKESITDFLDYASKGYVCAMQKSVVEQIAKTGTVTTTASQDIDDIESMTADEREQYYLTVVNAPVKPKLLEQLTAVNNFVDVDAALATLAEVTATLKEYKKALSKPVVLTDEQKESIRIQREKEIKFTAVIEAGLINVKILKGGHYKGSVTTPKISAVIAALSKDFMLVGNPIFDVPTDTMLITFRDGVTQPVE